MPDANSSSPPSPGTLQSRIVSEIENWIAEGGVDPAQCRTELFDGVAYCTSVSAQTLAERAGAASPLGGMSLLFEVISPDESPDTVFAKYEVAMGWAPEARLEDVKRFLVDLQLQRPSIYRFLPFRPEDRTAIAVQVCFPVAGLTPAFRRHLMDEILVAAREIFKELQEKFGVEPFYAPAVVKNFDEAA